MKRGVYIPRMHVEMVLFPQNQFEEDNPIYEEGTLEELEVDWLSFKCSKVPRRYNSCSSSCASGPLLGLGRPFMGIKFSYSMETILLHVHWLLSRDTTRISSLAG